MKYQKPTSRDLRRANRAEILRKIYFEEPISRLEISRQIGVSPATVTNIVADLIGAGILVESGSRQSEGGRPHTLLKINPHYGYFIGIEVGETFIEVQLFDMHLQPLGKSFHDLSHEPIDPNQIVNSMVAGVLEVLRFANLEQKDIIGAGIGFPGLVNPAKGLSIFAPNWGWHHVSITSLLRKQLSIPMLLDNGAKAMAVAEMLFGAGKGKNHIAVLLVGTGVGGGIISERHLFRGWANNAGEFGHMTMNIDGPLCRCGSHGCLEVYIGANGIIERYRQAAHATTPLAAAGQIETIQSILTAYEAGEPAARQTVNQTLRYLGGGIANLINACNPELVLLGGWSGLLLGSKFMPQIEEEVGRYAMQQSVPRTTLKMCSLGQGAVAIGAATLALEQFFETAGSSEDITVGGIPMSKGKR